MCHACTAVPKEKKCSHAKMTKIKSIHSATAFRLCPATTSFGLLRVYEMLYRSSSTVNDAVINQQARAPVNVFVRSRTCIVYDTLYCNIERYAIFYQFLPRAAKAVTWKRR